MIDNAYPNLAMAVDQQLAAFPEHQAYLDRRFADQTANDLRLADDIALLIDRVIGGDWASLCSDYRWLSGVVLAEEMFFRRNGCYRLRAFSEAQAEVYDNKPYMARYMNGLLASQLWWRNHTQVLGYFRDRFLPGLSAGGSHLEVGPGHGLLLAMAAAAPQLGRVEAWEVSAASLELTRRALTAMGAPLERIVLRSVDLFDSQPELFDSIVFSEVLEHLEDPRAALAALRSRLKPGGRLFLNAPVNSPAPDHIYLFRTPEEVVAMAQEAGFVVEDALFAPGGGASLDRARRLDLTISVALTARH